jgi:hypothetical protein
MRHLVIFAPLAALLASCFVAEADRVDDPAFPLEPHILYPQYYPGNGQIAAGRATGEALEQPIGFSHNLHAQELNINCQYCHSEARRSIHGGVPPLQTCMGCHQYVKPDNPQIKQIHMAWCGQERCQVKTDEYGQPIVEEAAQTFRWNKVHDLPDYVNFTHKRHVRAGVNCTECHGQVQLQGQYRMVDVPKGQIGDAVPEAAVTGDSMAIRKVDEVMVREASLQMGWCLNCHAGHPSIDENYGDQADLRRAELKDCWTCHK